jgi:hypothetical protein
MKPQFLFLVECSAATHVFVRGWRGYLTDEEFGPAEVAILCPRCADREFGEQQPRLQEEDE